MPLLLLSVVSHTESLAFPPLVAAVLDVGLDLTAQAGVELGERIAGWQPLGL